MSGPIIFSNKPKLTFFREGSILTGHLPSLRAIAGLLPETNAKQTVLKNLDDIETLALTIDKILSNKLLLINPNTVETLKRDVALLVEKWDSIDITLSSSALFAQAKVDIEPTIEILKRAKELDKAVKTALKSHI